MITKTHNNYSPLMEAAIFLFFLSLSAFSTVITAQQRNSNISLGSSLSPTTTNNSWLSPSGQFAFGFYPQGNGFAVGIWFARILEKTVVWTANRDDPPLSNNVTLLFTSDGRLVLRSTQGQDKTVIDPSLPSSSASMLDSGNFVIYNSNGRIIWETFTFPTDTILPGQPLLAGKDLRSSVSASNHLTGTFLLAMQTDGNLVQYPIEDTTKPYSYWASGTVGSGDNVSLNLDDDGHLYLLNGTGYNIKDVNGEKSSNNGSTFYRMTIDADGIFRLYSHSLDQNGNWSIRWNSTNDGCSPTGLCGLNAYCSLQDQQPVCVCLPDFDFIDPIQQTLGCMRNFSAKSSRNIAYNMNSLRNIEWEDEPYHTLSSTPEDDCRQACLGDSDCEVALLKDGNCKKQRLPLKYGRRKLDDTTITLVKVSTEDEDALSKKDNPTTKGEFDEKGKKELRLDILIISIAFVTCAIIILVVSGVLVYRYRVWAYTKIKDIPYVGLTEEIGLRSFTYEELKKATDNFKVELGRGSFGIVFKGALLDGQRLIAVKRLEKVLDEGEREFRTEMTVIGRTHHRNLVRLLGYCHDQSNRVLVYEYMGNGSLADLLFKSKEHPCWDERVGIALNIARGILYLHEECETQIIHCDIKPQNILMDENRYAKISDFGLAKLLKHDQTRTFTGIRGTRGYVAPEWHRNMPITVKADVFSFGIVLLEIICCRRSVDANFPDNEVILSDWVYDCFDDGAIDKLVSEEEVDKRKLEKMVRVGLWCIQEEPSLRPSMKKVVLMLEGTVDVPIPPSPSSFLSTI